MTEFSDKVVSILEPIIGKSMAAASIKVQCKKMGISPAELSSKHADELIKHLHPALSGFSGKEYSERIMEKIKNLK